MQQIQHCIKHEILATGCIRALAKASNLFREVAYRAATCFVLELELVDFAFAFLAVVLEEVPG